MVDEADVDERERLGEPLGDGAVGDAGLGDARRVSVRHDEGGGVVHQGAAHHDAWMDGGGVHGALKEGLVRDGLVPVVEEDGDEDLVAKSAKPGLEVAPGVGRRGERPVASKPGQHPARMELVDRVHPRPVLGRKEHRTQQVVGVVEELAQPPRGGKRRDVDVDADEAEQLVVVEGGGSRALDAGEQRLGSAAMPRSGAA